MGTKGADNRQYAAHDFRDNHIEHRYAKVQLQITTPFDRRKALIRFAAPDARRFFPDHGIYDNRANRSFMLRVYCPPAPTANVAIVFNGLDETIHQSIKDQEKPFQLYDDLGQNLSESGILTILLPTPYHMNRVMTHMSKKSLAEKKEKCRALGEPYIDWTVPTNALMRYNHHIFRNHLQGFRETVALVRFLKKDPSIFRQFKNYGDPITSKGRLFLDKAISDSEELHISLVGYSLGGLRAMSEFLRDRHRALQEKRDPVFSSCVAMNSGGGLQSLPAPPWVPEASWKRMIDDLLFQRFEEASTKVFRGLDIETRKEAKLHYAILEDVFLGQGLSVNVKPEVARFILFVLGGGDALVPLRSLERFAPLGGLNIFQVAGMGHILDYDDYWKRWRKPVFGVVAEFTKSARLMDVPLPRVARTAALLDHSFGILPFNADISNEKPIKVALDKLERRFARGRLTNKALGNDLGQVAKRLRQDSGESELDKQFLKFCGSTLRQLSIDVQGKSLAPSTYSKERRHLLIGFFFLSGDPGGKVQEMWSEAARTAKRARVKLGEYMLEHKLIDKQALAGAVEKHLAAVAHARFAVAHDFDEYLSKEKKIRKGA